MLNSNTINSDAIILVGFPTSGKTTIGRALAKNLDLPHYDLDKLISNNHNLSIAHIFKIYGEEYFRQEEAKMLKQVLTNFKKPLILSLGGGTVCYHNNLSICKEKSTLVYLHMSFTQILNRVQKIKNFKRRPLLKDLSKSQLYQLFKYREDFYKQADITIDIAPSANVQNVVTQLRLALKNCFSNEFSNENTSNENTQN